MYEKEGVKEMRMALKKQSNVNAKQQGDTVLTIKTENLEKQKEFKMKNEQNMA